MYDFSSVLFWYKFIFMTELLAAEGTFIFLLTEREHFFSRAVIAIVGLYVFSFALPVVGSDALSVSVLFFVLFAASLGAMKFCFREKWSVVLFCGIWAYTVQHLAYVLGNYSTIMAGISNSSFYEGDITAYNAGSLLIGTAVYVVVYLCSLFAVHRLFRNIGRIRINAVILILLSVLSLTIEVVINAFVVSLKVEEISTVLLTICYIYDCIGCLLTIALLVFSLRNKSLEQDKAMMSLMLRKERENFELRKDKIEKINIMCHDLKHRIRELGETGYAADKLKKLESAIKSYDRSYRTGNEVLDVILTEIGERCEEKGVQFICIADGVALRGIEPDHLYSLFDNALVNALDAVLDVTEPEKRYISLSVIRRGGMISIHIENYFSGEKNLIFKSGVPQTTKEEAEWHGFGMRSIQRVVEYYDGGMKVSVDGDMFTLNVFLPCPPAEEETVVSNLR